MPQVSCPRCGQAFNITSEQWPQYAGRSIACTRCGQQFPVDGPGQAQAPPHPPGNYAPGAYPPGGYAAGGYAPGGYAPGPGFGGGAAYEAPRSNPMATWALVLGILSFCLSAITGLPAIVLGILGMRRAAEDPRAGGRGLALAGLILGVLGTFLVLLPAILLPSLNRARQQAITVKCANSMRQIGVGLHMYADANSGQLPDSVDDLVKQGYLQAPLPTCPAHDRGRAGRAGAAQTAAPGYIYLGKGMNLGSAGAAASMVLLYERPAHNGGMNVLYADGHVEHHGRNRAPPLVADLERGVNPPTIGGGK